MIKNQRMAASNFWQKSGPIAIAHRGGDAVGGDKENTLEAFEAAWKLGYKYAEADVIVATTGEVMVAHGTQNWLQAGVSRGIPSRVLQMMTHDQIQHFLKPGGLPVPTVEELLTSFPKMKFVLDIKTDEALGPLVKILKRLKAVDRVCVSDLDYSRNLRFIKACRPYKASTGLTVGRGLRFRNINMLLLKTGRLSDAEAIFMHHSLVSRPMVDLIHKKGFKAAVWTVNSSLGIKHALRSGADGVISDRVGLLKEIIESKA
jgi:glycerophosphoryl diester phosphodiesterase